MENIVELLSGLGFYQAIWLLPLVCALHVMEELPRFPDWARRALGVPYTRAKFVAENAVLFAQLMTAVLLTTLSPPGSVPGVVGLVLVLSAAVGLFLNMIFHSFSTLRSGVYSPGTVTACLLFPTASALVIVLAALEGLLTVPYAIVAALLGAAMLPLVVTVVHRIIDRGISRKKLGKVALFGLLPAVLVPLAMAIFDADVVQRVMVYAGPLALLPLVLKWAVQWKRRGEAGK